MADSHTAKPRCRKTESVHCHSLLASAARLRADTNKTALRSAPLLWSVGW